MRVSLVTGPAAEPVTLEEAKLHLRVELDFPNDDALIRAFITAAREAIENETGRTLVTSSWRGTLDSFPCSDWIDVPKPPLQSVSSITYVDNAGAVQTWASSKYLVDTPTGATSQRGRIGLAFGETWPVTQAQLNAVTIDFVAGYGAASVVPSAIKAALLLYVGALYEHREEQVAGVTVVQLPVGAKNLLLPYRTRKVQ